MPLPTDWDGTFYDAVTKGDLLFDMPPGDFAAMVAARPDCEFLLAGAIFDLFWNHHHDLCIEFVNAARSRRPGLPWGTVPALVLTARSILESGAELAVVKRGAYAAIAALYTGDVVHAMSMIHAGTGTQNGEQSA